MTKKQPKFNLKKWQEEYDLITKKLSEYEEMLDDVIRSRDQAQDVLNALVAAKRFLTDGPEKEPKPAPPRQTELPIASAANDAATSGVRHLSGTTPGGLIIIL